QGDLRLPRSEKFWTWRNFFLRLNDVLKILHPFQIRPMRKRALEEAERWMLERIGEGSDGLAAVYPAMLNCLIALRVLGYPKDHPVYKKAAQDFAGLFVNYPDVDDTAMVLMALRLAKPEENWSLEKTFRRALDWQLSFQCRDGGWAAFDKNVTTPWLEDMPFADHNAILDPTCSDLTARTLELLGYIGFNPKARCVRDAIHYLIETQEADGSWYGRWGVNYIYGTWQVLRGLRAIGHDMTQDWTLRGRDWLESCQNDDGGW